MTDKEKLHQILSSLWKNDDSVGNTYYNQALQDVQTAIDLQKEYVNEDLGDYINELSKQFPEISFAKLSRIAVRVDKWQKEQMMAKAVDATLLNGNLIKQKRTTHPLHIGDKVKVIIKTHKGE